MKKAIFSNCRDAENRSKKLCVCGAHSEKARDKRRSWSRETFRKLYGIDVSLTNQRSIPTLES